MKYLQIDKTTFIHVDSVEAIILGEDGTFKILTSTREYVVHKNFVEQLLEKDLRAENVSKMTTQFFGG